MILDCRVERYSPQTRLRPVDIFSIRLVCEALARLIFCYMTSQNISTCEATLTLNRIRVSLRWNPDRVVEGIADLVISERRHDGLRGLIFLLSQFTLLPPHARYLVNSRRSFFSTCHVSL